MEQTVISDLNQTAGTCILCNNQVKLTETFCSNCGYPQHGSIDQKNNFMEKRERNKITMAEAKEKVRSATIVLAIMSGIALVVGLFYGANGKSEEGVSHGISFILYGLLAWWSVHKPFPAILSGFILYLTFNIINAFEDPVTIFQGILFKVIFIVAFVKGVIAAKKAQDISKETNDIHL
jgi:hypothetical protein